MATFNDLPNELVSLILDQIDSLTALRHLVTASSKAFRQYDHRKETVLRQVVEKSLAPEVIPYAIKLIELRRFRAKTKRKLTTTKRELHRGVSAILGRDHADKLADMKTRDLLEMLKFHEATVEPLMLEFAPFLWNGLCDYQEFAEWFFDPRKRSFADKRIERPDVMTVLSRAEIGRFQTGLYLFEVYCEACNHYPHILFDHPITLQLPFYEMIDDGRQMNHFTVCSNWIFTRYRRIIPEGIYNTDQVCMSGIEWVAEYQRQLAAFRADESFAYPFDNEPGQALLDAVYTREADYIGFLVTRGLAALRETLSLGLLALQHLTELRGKVDWTTQIFMERGDAPGLWEPTYLDFEWGNSTSRRIACSFWDAERLEKIGVGRYETFTSRYRNIGSY